MRRPASTNVKSSSASAREVSHRRKPLPGRRSATDRPGHDAVHVGDLAMLGAPDELVMAEARRDRRVLVTADTDFGALLAVSGASGPSVILFRREGRRPEIQADLLIGNVDLFDEPTADGFIAVVGADRIRIRGLPI